MTPQIQQLQQQLAQQPNNPGLLYELGRCYLAIMQPETALHVLQQALSLAPKHPQILMQLGNAASLQGNEAQAANYFKQSLAIEPAQADVWFNLANSLRKLGDLKGAISHYQHAIQLHPQDADYFNNLGNAYREAGELPQAIASYQTACEIHPQLLHAKVHWIHQKQQVADWEGLESAISEVRTALANKWPAQLPPFAFLAMPGTTDAEQLQCASLWAQRNYAHVQPLPVPAPRPAGRRIKLAYLSSDFRRHPLAFLVTEVIAGHDRSQFEVFLYSQAKDDQSSERMRFQQAADHWIEIATLSDAQAAQHMREKEIDILIDLTGYTQNSRSGIVAYRPAHSHLNWLGFPGTMGYLHGKPMFDAIMVDETLNMPHLAEMPIVLPCYQPNNAIRPQADAGTREQHGLPQTGFVFCNFNQGFKITAEVFAVWMHILHQVPHSVLWLLESNQWMANNLRLAASNAGIDATRLIFAPRMPLAEHIARQSHADLMLDTLPYNAHTTASDALWQCVPMLTVQGETFSARVTASLLKHIGLPALICSDLDAYQAHAIYLAQHPAVLQTYKNHLLTHKHKLFVPKQFVQDLEQAYHQLLQPNRLG